MRGEPQDRCLLYVFRCAVYYASRAKHDPEVLKWWNWRVGDSMDRVRPKREIRRR